MPDRDGAPAAVIDEITAKVDTGALAHKNLVEMLHEHQLEALRDNLLLILLRELEKLSERIVHAEQLALQAIRAVNAQKNEPPAGPT
jgi:uncharacterized protein YjgD (DUF1641 family)